ncbi:hypothetical protein [Geobacter sp. 60473]|uniref:hypothetical protein n=1 Tax=Geobacter sp. 60473 TaxID=3080755 RepID=UPI002B2AE3DF|nr:hypothetical protein GEO60473_11560 [Geobacter sp. 60473]
MNSEKKQGENPPSIHSCMLEFDSLAVELERAANAVHTLGTLLWHEQKKESDEQILLSGVMELLSGLGDKLEDLKKRAEYMIPEGFLK